MKQSKILSVLLAVLTACLVLSSSVAVPILCRPFYYAHIGPLGLVQATGLTEEAIRHAYDETSAWAPRSSPPARCPGHSPAGTILPMCGSSSCWIWPC
mgnify:CR=1 FL=1